MSYSDFVWRVIGTVIAICILTLVMTWTFLFVQWMTRNLWKREWFWK